MSEYWIEIHPDAPAHIVISDGILNILKKMNFINDNMDIQILPFTDKATIIFYKLGSHMPEKSILVNNKIINNTYINLSKIYKTTTKIPLDFTQEDVFLQENPNFDVFVVDIPTEKSTKNREETLEDVFK